MTDPPCQINALDALITAYNAVSVLRQQTQLGDIIQCQITNGGLKPSIIHSYASGQFVVRSATQARLDALKVRVIQCLTAGAVATGAKLNITPSKYSEPITAAQFADVELTCRRAGTPIKTTCRQGHWGESIGDILTRSAGRFSRTMLRLHRLVRIKAMSLMRCRACIRISGFRVRVVGRILGILRGLRGVRMRM